MTTDMPEPILNPILKSSKIYNSILKIINFGIENGGDNGTPTEEELELAEKNKIDN